MGDALVQAVRDGDVQEATVDDHLTRFLRLADRVGALGSPPEPTEQSPSTGPDITTELIQLAASSMVVLTNRDDLLPLNPGRSVALIGRLAIDTTCVGGGSTDARKRIAYWDGRRATSMSRRAGSDRCSR